MWILLNIFITDLDDGMEGALVFVNDREIGMGREAVYMLGYTLG